MHTYPFHAGDYLKDTVHWSEDEAMVQVKAGLLRDLAYRRLLDLYYAEEEPIPAKTRLVAIRIRMLAHEEIVASVLKEKFRLIDGRWHQKRTDAEIARYQKKAATARENGKKGGRPTEHEPDGNLSGSDPAPTRTITRTKNHKKTPVVPGSLPMFDLFWFEHPNKVGKPQAMKAYAAALAKGTEPQVIVDGMRRHMPAWVARKAAGEGEFIPHPSTWLNREGWNDEVMPQGDGPGGRAPTQRQQVALEAIGLATNTTKPGQGNTVDMEVHDATLAIGH